VEETRAMAEVAVVSEMAIMVMTVEVVEVVEISKGEGNSEREETAAAPETTGLPPTPRPGCYPPRTPVIAVSRAPIQVNAGIGG